MRRSATAGAVRPAGSSCPQAGPRGTAIGWGTGPFRVLQRAFPHIGPALMARARLAGYCAALRRGGGCH